MVSCKEFLKNSTHLLFYASEYFPSSNSWIESSTRDLPFFSSIKTMVFTIFTIWTCFSISTIPYVEVGLDQELTMAPDSHVSKYFKVRTTSDAYFCYKIKYFSRLGRRWMNCYRWDRQFTGFSAKGFHSKILRNKIWFAVDLAVITTPSRPLYIWHRIILNCTYLEKNITPAKLWYISIKPSHCLELAWLLHLLHGLTTTSIGWALNHAVEFTKQNKRSVQAIVWTKTS